MTVAAIRPDLNGSDYRVSSSRLDLLRERFDFRKFLWSDEPFEYFEVEDRWNQEDCEFAACTAVLKMLGGADQTPPLLDFIKAQSEGGSRLSHSNIAATSPVQVLHGEHFSIMKFPRGHETLRDRLLRTGWLDPANTAVWSVVLQLSEALRYAHGEGILHLSLRPEAILIDRGEDVFVTDFGFKSDGLDPSAMEELLVRSNDYTSPELRPGQDEPSPDQRSDIYSLGVILYELLTDRLPYTKTLQKQRYSAIPPHLIVEAVSEPLSEIILSMIDPDPRRRPESIETFQKTLIDCLDKERGTQYWTRFKATPTNENSEISPVLEMVPEDEQCVVGQLRDYTEADLATAPQDTGDSGIAPRPAGEEWITPDIQKISPRTEGSTDEKVRNVVIGVAPIDAATDAVEEEPESNDLHSESENCVTQIPSPDYEAWVPHEDTGLQVDPIASPAGDIQVAPPPHMDAVEEIQNVSNSSAGHSAYPRRRSILLGALFGLVVVAALLVVYASRSGAHSALKTIPPTEQSVAPPLPQPSASDQPAAAEPAASTDASTADAGDSNAAASDNRTSVRKHYSRRRKSPARSRTSHYRRWYW